MAHFTNQHDDTAPKTISLSAEQFARLVELLTPGYELAKRYLSEAVAAAEPDEKAKAKHKSDH